MSYNINVDDWYDEAVLLKAKGFSTRKIAVALFNNENYRNRLNIFYKQESVIEDVEKRAKELEIEDSVIGVQLQNDYSNWEVKPKPDLKTQPKICYLDIEKSFNLSGHFGAWSQNLRQEAKFRESHILSYCYVFNDDTEIKGSIIPADELQQDFIDCLKEGKVHTTVDELLVLELWALFNNSDVIVAYNGRGFDVKEIQARFLMYGLPPTTPVKVIDPLLIVKDKFRLPFKSLKYVAEFLGVTQKLENSGNDLWKKATMGDEQALEDMYVYNQGDVTTLREVYKKLQGWGNSGTNLALYNDEHTSLCPHCSSDNISVIEDKFAYTSQRKYSLFRCNSCKAVLRSNRKEGSSNALVRVV